MIYFTIAKNECGYLIDSISDCYEVLRAKFPDEKIYKSDKPIVSIYVIKDQLNECFDKFLLQNINMVFSNEVDLEVKNNIITNISKFAKGSYQRQVLENFDIKVLIKNTTLINSIKEHNDRYLFTINNSRILNDLDNNLEN